MQGLIFRCFVCPLHLAICWSFLTYIKRYSLYASVLFDSRLSTVCSFLMVCKLIYFEDIQYLCVTVQHVGSVYSIFFFIFKT